MNRKHYTVLKNYFEGMVDRGRAYDVTLDIMIRLYIKDNSVTHVVIGDNKYYKEYRYKRT